ncbi:hypothetical protein GOP47_0012906 [Adiantum capillus-veneris]|uniref:Uncharacterized protein n=1 Tax=Adiantum capillus-veneris TaxID=13818 RepID=A0A9D4URZ1_ADICA|nr:hypothetical protein GOP47_0012906 [Adiantum capillus-veneris]
MDSMQHDFSSFVENISTFNSLQSSLNTSFTAGGSDVLIFIHGFDTNFDSAIKRTAQLKYDLNFPGAAIAYSWNSAGSLDAYFEDETAIEITIPYFASFLRLCITQVSSINVSLIQQILHVHVARLSLRKCPISSIL